MKLSWILLALAAIAFSAGGKIVHLLMKADRVVSESVGIAAALLLCLLAVVARTLGGDGQAEESLHRAQE